jgi:hypothetical protein
VQVVFGVAVHSAHCIKSVKYLTGKVVYLATKNEFFPTRIKLRYCTKETDQHKKEMKEKPNTPKKQTLAQPNFHFQPLHSSTRRGK